MFFFFLFQKRHGKMIGFGCIGKRALHAAILIIRGSKIHVVLVINSKEIVYLSPGSPEPGRFPWFPDPIVYRGLTS